MTTRSRSISFFLLIIMVIIPFVANAQRGEKTLGVAGGFASYNESGTVSVYFQYSFANHVRIAPEFGFAFRNHGKTGVAGSIDMQFPFRVAKAFHIYPLAGLTFNNWSYSSSSSRSRLGFDFGGGFDIRLTSQLKISLQGKYSLMKDTGGAWASVGFGYVF